MKNTITIHSEPGRESVMRQLAGLNLDKSWDVTIEPHRRKRSLSQNNLYWKWMEEAGGHIGYDKNDMDEVCKEICDCPEKEIRTQWGVFKRRTTSGLDTKEMVDYMDRVYRKIVGDMGIFLTVPEMMDASGAPITELGVG